MNKIVVGQRIATVRIKNNFAQKDLAEYAGISVTFLSEIENGKRNMSADVLIRIARILMVSLDWLTSEATVCCEDCGMEHESRDWIDVTLSDDQWSLISGHTDGGGILCGGCIAKRAARLGYIALRARLEE